jgi:hypothetical protein
LNYFEFDLNSRRPALCHSGPPVSCCRRPALLSWPTGQPLRSSPVRPHAQAVDGPLPAPPRCPTRARVSLSSRPPAALRAPLVSDPASPPAGRVVPHELSPAGGSQAPSPRAPPRVARLASVPLRCVPGAPPLKGCFSPALCFFSRSDAALAVPSLASASSHRTALEDATTPSEPPSTGTPLRWPLPANPPSFNLLRENRLCSSCSAHPLRDGGALTENLAAG